MFFVSQKISHSTNVVLGSQQTQGKGGGDAKHQPEAKTLGKADKNSISQTIRGRRLHTFESWSCGQIKVGVIFNFSHRSFAAPKKIILTLQVDTKY